ncbi:MAG: NADPH:quinone reductase [Sphingomonadales bacterium]|jgi:NADPH2:quinone reductase|nr:NADPH:quinone reductase [Sphingomonadales bacterium]
MARFVGEGGAMSARYRLVVRRTGGPEVIEREALGPLAPGPGEVLIRHEAIGLNYIDTYHRSGLYPLKLPSGLGSEGAGLVEAADQETGFAAGERIAYAIAPPGAYATHRLIAADRLVRLPEAISAETAAAAMLKGCTAEMLVERCARVRPGDWVLVHAAAGGVGSILVPWLKAVGAKVIAHAGSPEKAALAAKLGADHALSCPFEALAGKVREITGGAGVRIVFDGVGAASWEASLASLARRGLMVSYGNASGPVPPFSPLVLARHGSLFLTRPTLADYVADPSELQASAARLFAMIGAGAVKVRIGARFPLAEAADAHRALESRATTGSTLLIP